MANRHMREIGCFGGEDALKEDQLQEEAQDYYEWITIEQQLQEVGMSANDFV
ncbi:hypothetical protein D3C75_1386950 [compost metagenome]